MKEMKKRITELYQILVTAIEHNIFIDGDDFIREIFKILSAPKESKPESMKLANKIIVIHFIVQNHTYKLFIADPLNKYCYVQLLQVDTGFNLPLNYFKSVLYRYTEYDIPELMNRNFTEKQLQEVYRDLTGQGIVDRAEYPDFDCWFYDMLKAGLFVVEQSY